MSTLQPKNSDGSRFILQEEVLELTNQFYVTLRTYFAKIRQDGKIRNQPAYDRIEELLKPGTSQNWTNAYEVEQLLVHLFKDDTLSAELKIRLLEARSVLNKELADAYDEQVRDAGKLSDPIESNEQRRTLLGRLVNDLQWRYVSNEARRRYSKFITNRTAVLFTLFWLAFIATVAFIAYRSVKFTYEDLNLFPVAGLAGAWGATFSLLVTLRGRLDASKFDDLKLMRHRAVLLSRALIGAGAACILYFFLLSGLLGGTAFPKLSLDQSGQQTTSATSSIAPADTSRLPKRDLALLVVWCFIAGFSEQLIPGLLASTEAKANGTSTNPTTPGTAGAAAPGGALTQANSNSNRVLEAKETEKSEAKEMTLESKVE